MQPASRAPSYADDVIGLYRRHATAWAADRGREGLAEAAWLDRFLAILPPRSGVLDIGCGCGEPIAGYLIGRGCTLTGIDSAPEMIAACKQRFPLQAWQTGDMRALDLGRVFDGLIAWDSFFHLSPDDQRRTIPTFREHAAGGAVLMFTSGPDHGEGLGQFGGEPLYHASLDAAEYRRLLQASDFDVIDHVVDDPTCRRTVWLARRNDR